MGERTKAWRSLAFQALCLHAWPGNVRELEKVLATADALARGAERIAVDHLPQTIAAGPHRIRSSPIGRNARPAPSKLELEDVIRRCEGNMARVARELGRKAPLLYRWAKRFNIDINAYRREPLPAGAVGDGEAEAGLTDVDDDELFDGTSPDLGEATAGGARASGGDDERDLAGD